MAPALSALAAISMRSSGGVPLVTKARLDKVRPMEFFCWDMAESMDEASQFFKKGPALLKGKEPSRIPQEHAGWTKLGLTNGVSKC
jgi:hypothetical protein